MLKLRSHSAVLIACLLVPCRAARRPLLGWWRGPVHFRGTPCRYQAPPIRIPSGDHLWSWSADGVVAGAWASKRETELAWGPYGAFGQVGDPWREAVSCCPFVFVDQAKQHRSTLDAFVGEVRDGVGRWGWAKVAAAVGSGTEPQPIFGRRTFPSVTCGGPEHRVSTKNIRLRVFWRLLFVRQTRRTAGTAGIESYGGVQRLACDEGGRGAWGEARRPRGLAVSKGGWPAGRMNATALVSGRASSGWARVLLGLPVSAVRGGRPRACPWVTEGRSGSTTSPDRDPPGIEHPGSGPVGELRLGSGHYIGTDAARSKQG